MKTKIVFFICICVWSMCIVGCTLETSDNGKLDGNWQMTEIDSLNGHVTDVKSREIFYAVQFRLLQVNCYTGPSGYLFHFNLTSDSLKLESATSNDSILFKLEDAQPYGINSLTDAFKIEKLSSNNLILKSTKVRLTFRKF
jgi:hypothetical protein